MNESEFENELRGLLPVSPSNSLQGRIAAALPPAKSQRNFLVVWLMERMFWAAGGAAAVWLLIPRSVSSPDHASQSPTPLVAAAPRVSEEPSAWSDEGVQVINGGTPARMLRRLVLERHQSPDGSAVVRVPREDVILLPVSFR